jgi:pimeloyl-ACP methyl ester carboxylesterase
MKKIMVKLLSTIFPNKMVSVAYNQLTNPQVKKLRPRELAVLDTANKEVFKFKGFDIQLYLWQGGDDKILLIHGWEGQAGNFSDFITELAQQNYTIIAFDAPSHGFSSKGQTSLFEFTELVGILIRKFGVTKLLSHSFGGVATTFALFNNKDLQIEKYVLLTTPDKFSERINDVSAQVGLTENVKNKLIARLEKETSLVVQNLNVSEFVKTINVAKPLIIHDRDDRVIPIGRSKNVYANWENCEFFEVKGTGHFRILRAKSVIKKALTFLQG